MYIVHLVILVVAGIQQTYDSDSAVVVLQLTQLPRSGIGDILRLVEDVGEVATAPPIVVVMSGQDMALTRSHQASPSLVVRALVITFAAELSAFASLPLIPCGTRATQRVLVLRNKM